MHFTSRCMTTLSGRLVVVLRQQPHAALVVQGVDERGFIFSRGGHLNNQLVLHGQFLFASNLLPQTGADQRINALFELAVDDLGRNELVLAHDECVADAWQVGNKFAGHLVVLGTRSS